MLAWFIGGCLGTASGQTKPATLASLAPYPVGAAINPTLLFNNAIYRQTVIREFSGITAENVMKPRYLQPEQNQFTFQTADSLVDFCRRHNKRLHGHTLVWHQSVPNWITQFQGDSAAWETVLKTHIQTVAAHFRGKVASWDVVNEAISDTAGRMRPTIWQQHLGNDYVARCFQYAHEADPDAKLFYNEYGIEHDSTKLMAMLHLVDDLQRRGIPIDGVGMQLHISKNTPEAGIRRAMQEFARRGLLIHVSELDIRVNTTNDSLLTMTNQLMGAQAEKVRQVVMMYNRLPAASRFGITTWGVADHNSWVMKFWKKEDYPLLFDKNYQPKLAYRAFANALKMK